MSLSTVATGTLCRVSSRCVVAASAILVAMILAAPVAAQQPEPIPPETEKGTALSGAVPDVAASLYSFSLGYGPGGDIVTSQDSVNGHWTYSYDPFNRLAAAIGPGRTFTYAYDRNGNRWRQTSSDGQGSSPEYGFDTANNRIVGMTYDALGNIINDGVHTYTYDAENRLIKVDGGATAEYAYDALGRRVRKATANGSVTEYLHDLAGRVAAERDTSTRSWNRREVYAAGRHVATYAGGTTYFHHQDWLGTNRVTTLPDGTIAEQCTNLPFGDGLTCTQSSGTPPTASLFADYERDRETLLDHTWFRKYSSAQGRWTTADPYLGSMRLTNPQSLNRYAYVTNDPLNLRDPLGLDGVCVVRSKSGGEDVDHTANDERTCKQHGGTWYPTRGGIGDGGTVSGKFPPAYAVPISWYSTPIQLLPVRGGGARMSRQYDRPIGPPAPLRLSCGSSITIPLPSLYAPCGGDPPCMYAAPKTVPYTIGDVADSACVTRCMRAWSFPIPQDISRNSCEEECRKGGFFGGRTLGDIHEYMHEEFEPLQCPLPGGGR